MKYVAHFVKKYVIDALENSVTYGGVIVPVYGDVPANNTYPFITVYTVDQLDSERNSDDFGYDVSLRVEVVTKFNRYKQDSSVSEQIMSQCTNLIAPNPNSTLDMSADDLKNYSIENVGINMLKEEYEDKVYARLIADMSFKIQEA